MNSDHVAACSSIRASLEKYVATCANLGILIIQDAELSATMFQSLEKINTMFSEGLPSVGKFIQIFSQLLQTAKMNSSKLFSSAFGFLSILFKSREFFREFEELDGFSLVFTLFFLSNEAESTKYLIQLLFEVVPAEFYKTLQNQTTLEVCLDALPTSKAPCVAVFISNFVASCFIGDPNIFSRFKDDGGFLQLNTFVLENCDDNVTSECYDVMVRKSNVDEIVVQSLFELFVNTSCRVSLRTEIVKIIEKNIGHDKQNFEKFNGVIPISEWMFPSPQIDSSGYETLASFLFGSFERGFLTVEDYLDPMIKLVAPPYSDGKPISIFLGLIDSLLIINKLTPVKLIDHQFLSLFVVKADESNLRQYCRSTEMQKILCQMFQSKTCEDYRFAIVQKVISVYDRDLTDFIVSLIHVDLSIEVFNLLLGHLTDLTMSDLIIESIRANRNSFDLFMECTGFDYVVEFLSTKPESRTVVLQLLDALASHGPKVEVEEFVASLNADSPLFKCDKESLKETSRKVGALLPFSDKSDKVSLAVMANRAKYGIQTCLKMGMKYEYIPGVHKLANLFCTPGFVQYLMMDIDDIHKNVNRERFPQRDVYEFLPADEFAFLDITAAEPIRSFACSLFYWKGMSGNFWAYGSACCFISEGMMIVAQDGVTKKLPLVDGWNPVQVSVGNGHLSCAVNGEVVDFTFSEPNIKHIVLGDKSRRLESNWIISTAISVNGSEKYTTEKDGSVYQVPFCGFATYFDGIWSVENIFNILDHSDDPKKWWLGSRRQDHHPVPKTGCRPLREGIRRHVS